jgi:hypothetical protein
VGAAAGGLALRVSWGVSLSLQDETQLENAAHVLSWNTSFSLAWQTSLPRGSHDAQALMLGRGAAFGHDGQGFLSLKLLRAHHWQSVVSLTLATTMFGKRVGSYEGSALSLDRDRSQLFLLVIAGTEANIQGYSQGACHSCGTGGTVGVLSLHVASQPWCQAAS